MSPTTRPRDNLGRFAPVTPDTPGEVTLFERIRNLERRIMRLTNERNDLRRSRDMWKNRALSYGRGGAGQRRAA